jgi:hypothetical protein
MRRHLLLFTACCTVAGAPDIAHAQLRNDSVTIAAGSQYDAGALQRFFVGENWRPLWLTPIRVPVLDMGRFAGGLTPERQGGGNQSITLHMSDPTGRTWLFRSVDKFLERGLPDEMRGHVMGDIVADHVSMLHPGGTHILPALLKAAGVLHVQPQLYVMPDDPRLGEFREQFAGMLGSIEERPNNLPDGEPGFAGSIRIRNSENFLDDLEDSQANRLDEAEFLRARLVDFLVGDPDRGTDQWRWARFGEDGAPGARFRSIATGRWRVAMASSPVSPEARMASSFASVSGHHPCEPLHSARTSSTGACLRGLPAQRCWQKPASCAID